jgi:hypothetical protein
LVAVLRYLGDVHIVVYEGNWGCRPSCQHTSSTQSLTTRKKDQWTEDSHLSDKALACIMKHSDSPGPFSLIHLVSTENTVNTDVSRSLRQTQILPQDSPIND